MGVTVRLESRIPAIAGRVASAASQVVRKTAFDVQAYAQMLVPVDTGDLKNSITVDIEDGGLTAIVSTNMEYALRIEFGFIGADSLGRVFNQSGQPYMTPAAEAMRGPFQAAMGQLERLL